MGDPVACRLVGLDQSEKRKNDTVVFCFQRRQGEGLDRVALALCALQSVVVGCSILSVPPKKEDKETARLGFNP